MYYFGFGRATGSAPGPEPRVAKVDSRATEANFFFQLENDLTSMTECLHDLAQKVYVVSAPGPVPKVAKGDQIFEKKIFLDIYTHKCVATTIHVPATYT